MTYTIKEVSEKVGLSIYTLRYYDKEGLLPFVARNEAGYREFTDGDLNIIHTICCLKNTGMKISKIRQYIGDVMAGPDSIEDRQQLLHDHREKKFLSSNGSFPKISKRSTINLISMTRPTPVISSVVNCSLLKRRSGQTRWLIRILKRCQDVKVSPRGWLKNK